MTNKEIEKLSKKLSTLWIDIRAEVELSTWNKIMKAVELEILLDAESGR